MTIWRQSALTFDPKNVGKVLLLKNSSISDFNGLSLNGGEITINPSIESDLKNWWSNEGENLETPSLSKSGVWFSSSKDKLFTLQEALASFCEVGDKGEYYCTMATIKELRSEQKVYLLTMILNSVLYSQDKALYKACGQILNGRHCYKKVIETSDGSYRL